MAETLVRFVHITDTHLTITGRIHVKIDETMTDEEIAGRKKYEADINRYLPVSSVEACRQLVTTINNLPLAPDFVLHTGDIFTTPEANDEYHLAQEIFADLNYPIHYLVGNGDFTEAIQNILAGIDNPKPTYDYDFEVNGVHVVCLDSASNDETRPHHGLLNDQQMAWLTEICERSTDTPLVVALHHHVQPVGHPLDYSAVGQEMHKVLLKAKHRLRVVLSGHIHAPTDTHVDGILYNTAPSAIYPIEIWPGTGHHGGVDFASQTGFNWVAITTEGVTMCQFYYALKPN